MPRIYLKRNLKRGVAYRVAQAINKRKRNVARAAAMVRRMKAIRLMSKPFMTMRVRAAKTMARKAMAENARFAYARYMNKRKNTSRRWRG